LRITAQNGLNQMNQRENDWLLKLDDLAVSFRTRTSELNAVRGVSFEVPKGKTLALLGESGCGKSVTGMSILRLIEEPGFIRSGKILYRDEIGTETDLASIPEGSRELRRFRGSEISMIFQDARNSMTPVYTIGQQIAEMIVSHEKVSRTEAWQRATDSLVRVGIPAPERRVHEYPHQLSGGMCQRAMIAMGLSCNPRLIIADEPTTALDVTIQAQVLNLLMEIQKDYGMSILIITHDMGVVAEVADEVAVMYLGKIVETGPVNEIFDNPLHPYTKGLFASVPRPDSNPLEPLVRIKGSVPDLQKIPQGCPFRGRCESEQPECTQMPDSFHAGNGHSVSCWLYGSDKSGEAETEAV